ncbi:MAG TPA: 5-formyltetrahydrofolate cyclo-ligase [Verrucomicrobiae bacterium]|nr:5-formyltetrahydrofolate cyclo-ligase [Verrucomicrobiae bacterium]
MISSIANSKSELRAQIRERLDKISLAVRTVESMELCARLEPQLRSAQTILFYAPLPDELDVWPLLEKWLKSKTCALPAFDAAAQSYIARRVTNLETDIAEGKFGVSEPTANCEKIPFDKFNLILVPGMAFDLRGNRLGRGKGFYDRILSEADGVKCGVAYDFQLLEKIPAEPHDTQVDFIFTPKNCVTTQLNQ